MVSHWLYDYAWRFLFVVYHMVSYIVDPIVYHT
jgi:hypothetical protein